jgi:hypothetical protein
MMKPTVQDGIGPLDLRRRRRVGQAYKLSQRKLPKRVQGILGPIRVTIKSDLRERTGALGLANYSDRVIEIDADELESKDPQWLWKVFWHEVCHFWLEDSGVGSGFTKDQKEQLCDAYAASRVKEMR